MSEPRFQGAGGAPAPSPPSTPTYLLTSNTTPIFPAPPNRVVPYRFPALSRSNAASGNSPSPRVNRCRSVSVYLPPAAGVSSNTDPTVVTPSPFAQVPYRLPLPSMTRPLYGFASTAPVNEYNTRSVHP